MSLPEIVGLCPTHGDVFYVAHAGNCPEPGCPHLLVEYVPREQVAWTTSKCNQAAQCLLPGFDGNANSSVAFVCDNLVATVGKLDELRSRVLHLVGKRRPSDDFDGALR